MTEGRPYLLWPGGDDRIIVEEMLRDPQSGQWYECREFVKKCVQVKARNIPQDHWDDITQDAMIRVNKSLATFKYQCTFRTWLFVVVRSCIIDARRKLTHAEPFMAPLDDPHDDIEHDSNALTAKTTGTAEDQCIIRDELDQGLVALHEYLSTHANPLRNGRILDMVMFEGRSLEDAAKAIGCSAPVAGYVVRSAQRYARERLGHQR